MSHYDFSPDGRLRYRKTMTRVEKWTHDNERGYPNYRPSDYRSSDMSESSYYGDDDERRRHSDYSSHRSRGSRSSGNSTRYRSSDSSDYSTEYSDSSKDYSSTGYCDSPTEYSTEGSDCSTEYINHPQAVPFGYSTQHLNGSAISIVGGGFPPVMQEPQHHTMPQPQIQANLPPPPPPPPPQTYDPYATRGPFGGYYPTYQQPQPVIPRLPPITFQHDQSTESYYSPPPQFFGTTSYSSSHSSASSSSHTNSSYDTSHSSMRSYHKQKSRSLPCYTSRKYTKEVISKGDRLYYEEKTYSTKYY